MAWVIGCGGGALFIAKYAYKDTANIYDTTKAKLEQLGLDSECVGGGKIQHDPTSKSIKVYGHSTGFGKADHEVTVGILKNTYKSYNITYGD